MSDHLRNSEIQEYLDGELDNHQTARIQAHLDVCEKCRDEIDAYSNLYKALYSQPVSEFSPQFTKNIIASLNASPEIKPQRKLFDILLALGGIVFSIIITISFAGFSRISLFFPDSDSFGLGIIREQIIKLFMISDKLPYPYLFAGFIIIVLIYFLEKFLFRKKDLIYSI
jgi:hypothetical protein